MNQIDFPWQLYVGKLGQPDNPIAHVVCAAFAGFCGASVGTPSDVVKTRYMNAQKGAGEGYKSAMDCLVKTVKNEVSLHGLAARCNSAHIPGSPRGLERYTRDTFPI
jgi:hypothetical protein